MPALLRTRSRNEPSSSLSLDVTGKDKYAYAIAGVIIGLVALLVVGLRVAAKGRAWYQRHQELKRLKARMIANQQAWYRSTRPVRLKLPPVAEIKRVQHNPSATTLPQYKGPPLEKAKLISDRRSPTRH